MELLYFKIILFVTDIIYGTYLYRKVKNFGDSWLKLPDLFKFAVVFLFGVLVVISFWIK